MLDQLTLFAADTHASPSPLPGSAEARKMTAISGRSLVGSWLNSGPLGSLERTLLGTSAWGSTTCFLTWRDKVTPAGRLLFQLAPSASSTDEIDAGLWPTPTVPNGGRSVAHVTDWRSKSTAYHNGKKVQVDLRAAVRLWPTPSAGDDRDRGCLSTPSIKRRAEKGKQLNLSMVVSEESGALNPDWVEWLMGFPVGWTNLPSE